MGPGEELNATSVKYRLPLKKEKFRYNCMSHMEKYAGGGGAPL